MSKVDEAVVMYPATLMRAELYEERTRLAESSIIALRRRLRQSDPTLPHEYDGPSWWPIEQEWTLVAG